MREVGQGSVVGAWCTLHCEPPAHSTLPLFALVTWSAAMRPLRVLTATTEAFPPRHGTAIGGLSRRGVGAPRFGLSSGTVCSIVHILAVARPGMQKNTALRTCRPCLFCLCPDGVRVCCTRLDRSRSHVVEKKDDIETTELRRRNEKLFCKHQIEGPLSFPHSHAFSFSWQVEPGRRHHLIAPHSDRTVLKDQHHSNEANHSRLRGQLQGTSKQRCKIGMFFDALDLSCTTIDSLMGKNLGGFFQK